jgi:phage terminase large subunit GpA-like protein
MTPDEWGARYRVYPPTSGIPGPRDPMLTPYIIAFERAVHARTHKRVVLVISAQSGKSEAILDIIGQRMDVSPIPILYLGPTKQFIVEQWEPRIMELLDSAPVLARKVTRGRKMKKTLKVIGGVPLRLAHGGSSSALKSDPFGLALTDEADELMNNVKGAGNPIDLVDIRGDTYADFVHAIVSTPSEGPSEVEIDEDSGLEFWSTDFQEEVKSTIWRLWMSGTRYHWAWPCPHCDDYFIPRFKHLHWDKPKSDAGKELPSDPGLARRSAHLVCPSCGSAEIYDGHKEEMNARGVFVAPGQHVLKDGTVVGDPPESNTISFWVSGLASPFKSWGERAERYVTAIRSGDTSAVQAVMNGGFGELYTPGGGEVPEWHEVQKLASEEYESGQVPSGVRLATMTVDVQKSGLYYTVRGWGALASSWLIEAGFLQGETAEEEVWEVLEGMLQETYDGIPLRLALIDAGFRPGKKDAVPLHRVYEFCRRNKRIARATKGSSTAMVRPIVVSKIDVNVRGEIMHNALDLHRLDTDHFKRWVHERIRWDPDSPGAWRLPSDISEDYCRQVVSEARVKNHLGKVTWVPRARDNHYLDCEAMQAAAGAMLNVIKLRDATPVSRVPRRAVVDSAERREEDSEKKDPWVQTRGDRGEPSGSIWD